MSVDEQQSQAKIDSLVASGEDAGCVNLSELDELLTALELDDDDVSTLYERLDARGVNVSDDCGRSGVVPTRFVNGELATSTDRRAAALPQRDPQVPAAHRHRGGRAGQARRAR